MNEPTWDEVAFEGPSAREDFVTYIAEKVHLANPELPLYLVAINRGGEWVPGWIAQTAEAYGAISFGDGVPMPLWGAPPLETDVFDVDCTFEGCPICKEEAA